MKRLGIFFFYEKNGDVDDFITYYLRDLAPVSYTHLTLPTT